MGRAGSLNSIAFTTNGRASDWIATMRRTKGRRFLLSKERGHPRDLKRKVEKDHKDREGD
jgi:hypothetical protein